MANVTIRPRRDTTANWNLYNPILADKEMAFEVVTTGSPVKMKIGDGYTAWENLAYAVDFQAIETLVTTATAQATIATTQATNASSIAKTYRQNSTVYAVGDIVLGATNLSKAYFLKCTTAGTTSSSTISTWGAVGATTADGTVVWTTKNMLDSTLAGHGITDTSTTEEMKTAIYTAFLDTEQIFGCTFDGVNSSGTRLYKNASMTFTKATELVKGTDTFSSVAPFNIYRAIVKYVDGKAQIVAREGDTNFATYVANKYGDVFTMFPNFYYKRTQVNGVETWLVSAKEISGFSISPMHSRGGVTHDYIGVSSYQLGENGTDAQSMPGLPLKVNTAWTGYNTLMRAKGLYVADYAVACSLQILGSVKYNNLNWQSAIGSGLSTTYSGEGSTTDEKAIISETSTNRIVVANARAAYFAIGCRATLTGITFTQRLVTAIDVYDTSNKSITLDGAAFATTAGTTGIRRAVEGTGGADSVLGTDGMPTGTDGKTSIKTLGIENWYGNAWNILGGAFRYNDVDFYINTDVKNINDWPTTSAGAITAGWSKSSCILPQTVGYIQTMNYDSNYPWITITKTVGGTSDKPVGDNFYRDASTDFCVVGLGGSLNNSSSGGPFCAYLNFGLSVAYWNFGAFGLFVPE